MRPRCSSVSISLLACCLCALASRSYTQQSPLAQEAAPTLEINVNRVLVPVVLRDKQGHPIADLKKEDFEVVDNGKPHPVSAFNVEQRGPAEQHADTGAAPAPDSNAAGQSGRTPQRFIVFLFDDVHLSVEDLAQVQKAGAEVVDGLSGADIGGVVSISGRTNSGLTRDRNRLRDAIMSLQTHNVSFRQACVT